MDKVSGLTRGDRRRNDRLTRVRELVPPDNAIVALDLGENVQMLVVTDHDSRVLARKVIKTKAYQVGPGLEWAAEQAHAAGFVDVTVACEPTGSRWLQLQQLADELEMVFVCVQPLATHKARESEDYTRDKSDYKDAVLIARLSAQLRCYPPERIEPDWALLRHLGHRRREVLTEATARRQQLIDLLGLAWPAVLTAAGKPLDSMTWRAGLAVVLNRCDGRPAKLRRLGLARFTNAVRRELPRWGGQRICGRIVQAMFEALSCTDGAVPAHRAGVLKRAGWALGDLHHAQTKRDQVETDMLTALNQLGLTQIAASIPGLRLPAAAQILAEAGDPTRFATARSMVKHAGLNPAENTSGNFRGTTRISRRGNPGLRLAAWRATWALIRFNPVMAARYQHLTTRDTNRLTPGQAHVACAAGLLRWIHAITTTHATWDPRIATGQLPHTQPNAA
jgi:transposase